MAEDTRDEPFPWHLGVFDAHCHPTDTMSSIPSIPTMKARALTVMATRAQDQDLVSSIAESRGIQSPSAEQWTKAECIVPCFGWHPWFSHQMYLTSSEESQEPEPGRLQGEDKIRHYRNVLQPQRDDESEDDRHLFLSLPDPMPFSHFLAQTRQYLEKHAHALVGEIGLDRAFRVPISWDPAGGEQRDEHLTPGGREGRKLSPFRPDLQHQKRIFKMQLQLAAELKRAVSIHSVQAHGMVFDTLKELYEGHEKKVLSKRERKKLAQEKARIRIQDQEQDRDHDQGLDQTEIKEKEKESSIPYPPRICLHSYSGDYSIFKQYLNPSIPIEIYASFSTAINCSDDLKGDTPQNIADIIKRVPDHMLLVESDLHTAGEAMDQRLEDIVRRICRIKEWGLEEGVRVLGSNWRRFVFGTEGEGV